MRSIFILVPSLHPTGPVKGAIALANALSGNRAVTMVSLKPGPGADAFLDPNIRHVCLAGNGSIYQRIRVYKRLLREAGGRANTASLSLCMSADMVNLFCRSVAVTCASVRGNLPKNYRFHYGPLGIPLAMSHLAALRGMDHVVAMTTSMARQVARYTGKVPAVISNFVDEPALEGYRVHCKRSGPIHFVFLASLTIRKRPDLLIDALAKLRRSGVDAHLDLVGEGPLMEMINQHILRAGLSEFVTLHGHLSDPYHLLARADALVLPSLSEGLSRAGLEALYLGVPCVLRNIDGNFELVSNGVNGVLFSRDEELPDAMLAAAKMGRRSATRVSLLPPACAQMEAVRRYLDLMEAV